MIAEDKVYVAVRDLKFLKGIHFRRLLLFQLQSNTPK